MLCVLRKFYGFLRETHIKKDFLFRHMKIESKIEKTFMEILKNNNYDYVKAFEYFIDFLNEIIIYQNYLQAKPNIREHSFPIEKVVILHKKI